MLFLSTFERHFVDFMFRQIVMSHTLKWWQTTLQQRTLSWPCRRETLCKCLATLGRCVAYVDWQTTSLPLLKVLCRITCWWQKTWPIMASG